MKWPWYKFPTPIALLKLLGFRKKLREENLHNTAQLPTQDDIELPLPLPGDRHLVVRTADGSFNDVKFSPVKSEIITGASKTKIIESKSQKFLASQANQRLSLRKQAR
ncbi:MAG: hypothetical protein F6K22_14920 [Okeania sp. SIO2F4]|uniref:hypothetical protein n=1 Tax=Okeania sp. SIO2F4 TaxID=2607790 RepID=UPI00142C6493|nr:hypothetical protein [Okeania sp. SIO2F4]NES04014.1 hypothetical protein [Okeania sp. SIO2F4]